MKVTNTNDFPYTVGFKRENGDKGHYFFEPGQEIEIDDQDISTFIKLDGFSMEGSNEEPKQEVPNDKFICPVCNNEFTAKIALAGHMRSHK